MRNIKITLTLSARQIEVFKEESITGDSDDLEIEDLVGTYRVDLMDNSDASYKHKTLEGPLDYKMESFEKVVDAALVEMKFQIMRRFGELDKPDDLIKSFRALHPNS